MPLTILQEELYSYAEVIDLLDISPSSLKGMIRTKRFKPIRLGRNKYINQTQIKNYLTHGL